MRQLRSSLLLAALMAVQIPLFSQTVHWESMDGPYRPETRTHLRYPDGDRRYIGTYTGTFKTTDDGMNWVELSPILPQTPEPTGRPHYESPVSIYQSPAGNLFGCRRSVTWWGLGPSVDYEHFVSTDRGENWTLSPLRSQIPSSTAFAGGDTLYVSSGRGALKVGSSDFKNFTAYVNRSTDAGTTWTTIFSEYTEYATGGSLINKLYSQPGNLFAHRSPISQSFSWSFVLRSTDGGTTWRSYRADRLLFHPPDNLLRQRGDTLDIYNYSVNAYLEISTDNGASWTQTLSADSGFTSLISDDEATLLVLRKPGYELFRSTDAGHTWASLGLGPPADPLASIAFYGKAYLIGTTLGGAFYRSMDYGTSWIPILDLEGQPVAGTVQNASDSLFVVADWRGNWLESDDAGGTWRSVTCPFERRKITSLLALPSGSLIAGTPEAITRRNEEQPWSSSTILTVGRWAEASVWSLFYRAGPKFLAGTGGWRYDEYGTSEAGGVYSIDTSTVFSRSDMLPDGGQREDCRSLYSPTEGNIIVGMGQYLNRSTDQGETFSAVGPAGPVNSWLSIVEDSGHAIWAGNDSLGLYKSLDTGLTWTASNAGLTNLHTLSMAVAPNGGIFAGTRGGGVFRSSDSGATWTASGLSADTIQALTVGAGSKVYAGTTDGVFLSTDLGLTWSDISTGLVNANIHALTVGPDGTVYCGTWGEGVYRMRQSPLPDSTADRFPLSVGNTWTYALETIGPSLTTRASVFDTTRVGGLLYYLYKGYTFGYIGITSLPVDTLRVDSLGRVWRLEKSKKYMLFDFSVDSGATYQSVTSYPGPTTVYVKQNETVTVPAGTFSKCIDLFFKRGMYDESVGFVFAPGVGIVRWYGPFLGSHGLKYAVVDGRQISDVANAQNDIPTQFALEQNYPNPFNPRTGVRFSVPTQSGRDLVSTSGRDGQVAGVSEIKLVVYDLLGREVATLVNERKLPGNYEVTFDASRLSSGLYICRMTAGSFVQSRKMLLLR
jgi:photosystem II stability/assembly factor-like uncharacterized protein